MHNIAVFSRVISLCLLFCTQFAWSADVTVTSTDDTGTGTLREALTIANSGDTIVFALPASSTITLASTLTVTKNLAIDGVGSSGLTINGNHATSVLTINNIASATVSNLAIADGIVGIYSVGPLSVSKCTISGGVIGIESYSTLTVANSTIFGNSSPNVGGAIKIHPGFGTTTIVNNTFVNNAAHYGGAIETESYSPGTVTNNIFQGNSATQNGAAIYDASGKINADHNLYWNNPDQSGPGCYGCVSDTPQTFADPLLGSLADNGGPTQTYLPAVGGAAIDSGDDTACATPAVGNLDQRGIVRPAGAHCDIGAVESNDQLFLDGFEPAI